MRAALAVIGGGPAGLSTAIFACVLRPELRERLLVIERGRYPRDKICAGAIGARADRLLATVGVRLDVPAEPIEGMTLRLGTGTVCRRPGGLGRVVRRIEYDTALARAAADVGAIVRDGVTVHAVERRSDGVHLQTDAGPVVADAIVGADGVGSVVRRALGLGPGRLRAQAVEVDTEPVESDGPRDEIVFDLRDASYAGYAWDFPTLVAGRPLVSRGVYVLRRRDPLRPDPDPGVVLRERLRGLGLDPTRYAQRRFAERGFEPGARVSAPRVLLVGEAAGIDPVTGEGIAQAVQYGAIAGAYLAERWAERDFGFGDWGDVLRASRVGLDLRLRAALLPLAYGRARPCIEAMLARAPDLLDGPMAWFAGRRVPRGPMLRALFRAAPAALRSVLDATPLRRP
ncbi:MAG: NAD(P)/FAD-dependent oxidoreductase [Myxococcota bacterium]|nr:NAD(P)/FAD-dependent oxidoreductase [Myxococcota bacterium]MDW8363653.1 NAD(P)/FAD-dependent oxidoreductase [Myxococcales bacterium]